MGLYCYETEWVQIVSIWKLYTIDILTVNVEIWKYGIERNASEKDYIILLWTCGDWEKTPQSTLSFFEK